MKNCEHGKFYWACHNLILGLKVAWEKRRWQLVLATVAIVIFPAIARAWVQSVILSLRIYSFELIIAGVALMALAHYSSRLRLRGWVTVLGVACVVGVANWKHFDPHDYLTLYLRYQTLDIQELDNLPETDHERIQPLNSIRVLAQEAMSEVQQMSDPYFVRIDGKYRWTMSVEPSFLFPRLFGGVKEVVNVSATSASPNFSYENRYDVNFPVGERLLLGKNVHIATIRSFGLMRFLSYQPADVKYIKDDNGEWVELVSLIKWRGVFFPRPEFGGVQVIRQSHGGFTHWLQLMFVGDGEWIQPEKIKDHPFLRGQNLVPYEVGRYVAQSFRFQEGFFAPFPGYHKGDIRIPDLPSDVNDQPFITFFRFPDKGEDSKLYQYFALEPYEYKRQGLNTSVLFPADNIGPIKICRHSERKEAFIGVSAVAAKVMESKKQYDWNNSRPAEHRPYIRMIDGKSRFMWMTTVVTHKKAEAAKSDYIAGSMPEVVLTDAKYRQAVWMKPELPSSTWPAELKQTLGSVWKAD